jgi:DNA-directed RNA polymerase specialized sigma subunit
MSNILDDDFEFPIEADNAQMAARRLIKISRNTYNQMVRAFNLGSKIFWENNKDADPQSIASYLGTNAAEVFQLHHKLGTLISEINPSDIEKGLGRVGNFTVNEDGTVSVHNDSSSESEPNT